MSFLGNVLLTLLVKVIKNQLKSLSCLSWLDFLQPLADVHLLSHTLTASKLNIFYTLLNSHVDFCLGRKNVPESTDKKNPLDMVETEQHIKQTQLTYNPVPEQGLEHVHQTRAVIDQSLNHYATHAPTRHPVKEQGWHSWLVRSLRCERSLVQSPVTSHPCFDFFPFHVALISFKYP